jgi:predicted metalloprotease with PDZ domain
MATLKFQLEQFVRAGSRALIFLIVCAGVFSLQACSQCNFTGASTGESLRYVFEPVVASGKLILRITLEFRGGRDGAAELELPSDWAGQSHLEGQVKNLRALSSDTIVLHTVHPGVRTLRFPPTESVKISYDLAKDWQGKFDYPKQFRAVLEPSYFEFTTQNALIHPKLPTTEVVSANFDWQKLSADWTLETSFGADDHCQSFTGLWSQVNKALFAGGDFRVRRVLVENKPVVVAIRGKWGFTDEGAAAQIQKILAAERDFWEDHDFPYYLVTLKPYDLQNGSSNGSAFTNAFWLYLPGGDTFSYEIQNLLAHEAFHTWNPLKMGVIREPESSEKWFTEGFTVYYADVLLLRCGLLHLPKYLELVNRGIRDYEAAPAKNLSNKEIVARYEENGVNQLPGVRGPTLALWLDAQIRQQSHDKSSLDAVMVTLVRQGSANPAMELSSERVMQVAGKHLSRRSRKQLRSLVEDGASIPILNFPNNSCVHLTHRESVAIRSRI